MSKARTDTQEQHRTNHGLCRGCQDVQDIWFMPKQAAKRMSPLDNALFHDWKERCRKREPIRKNNIEQIMACVVVARMYKTYGSCRSKQPNECHHWIMPSFMIGRRGVESETDTQEQHRTNHGLCRGCQDVQDIWFMPKQAAKRMSPLDNALFHDWKERCRKREPIRKNNIEQIMACVVVARMYKTYGSCRNKQPNECHHWIMPSFMIGRRGVESENRYARTTSNKSWLVSWLPGCTRHMVHAETSSQTNVTIG